METNFWKKLKDQAKPILALAPMAGFTEISFRQLVSSLGADVTYSEMLSASSIFFNQSLESKSIKLAKWDKEKEKNFVIQVFGKDPEHFKVAVKILEQAVKPSGFDINLGCPASKVLKQGAGAELMYDKIQAREVIKAVLASTKLPVSIKIRKSVKDLSALEFLSSIQDLPLAALIIHGRSLEQGLAGKTEYGIVNELRPYFSGPILINGAINSLALAKKALLESQADGLALARGALARPYLFQEIKEGREINYSFQELKDMILQQAQNLVSLKGERALLEWRKQACFYVQGQAGASLLRSSLVKVNTLKDLEEILSSS